MNMKQTKSVGAIFIAFNAEQTLRKFYEEFPKHLFSQIILVDDASSDNTFAIAKELGITSFKNERNLGYGGNLKRALKLSIESGAEIIVDIHPDGEYLPSAISDAVKLIRDGADMVVGNRFDPLYQPLKDGMYLWKFMPILFMNWIARLALGLSVHDVHQGFRVYSSHMLNDIPFHEFSNDYLFSLELLSLSQRNGFKILQVPVRTRYSGTKRGASLKCCIQYSLGVFKIIFISSISQIMTRTRLTS